MSAQPADLCAVVLAETADADLLDAVLVLRTWLDADAVWRLVRVELASSRCDLRTVTGRRRASRMRAAWARATGVDVARRRRAAREAVAAARSMLRARHEYGGSR